MPLSTSTQGKQLSDQNTVGTYLGATASDVIGFFKGSGGVSQPSGNATVALSRAASGGSLATYTTTQSPPAVTTSTTAEVTFTILGASGSYTPAAGDVLILNKPTNQAGLGIGNVRVSGINSIAVTFSNLTSATITPTASQSYNLVGIRGLANLTATLTPAVVGSFSVVEQSFSVTGLRVGELVQIAKPTSQAGLDIANSRVVANNVLGIQFMNVTSAAITPTAAEGYTVVSMGSIDATGDNMVGEVNVGVVASIGATNSATSAEVSFTFAGLGITDIIGGVQKPTAQTGAGIVGQRAVAAGVVGITFAALGISITPTANEVYSFSFFRPNPLAPMKLYQATLTPVGVPNGTTTEVSFTVTGLLSSTPVWVNKPSYTAGLGIAGVRVAGTNTLAINYANVTSATITPPTEIYTIGNYQQTNPTASCALIQPFTLANQQEATLINAMQSAMQSLGLVSGT